MLVLSRKLDEALIIEGPCRIVVVGVRRGQVQLGIEAQREIPVWREELLDRQEQAKVK